MFQKYNCIRTKDDLKDLNNFLMVDAKTPRFKTWALDTEANGLDLKRSSVCGISLATSVDQGFYIPLLEWIPDLNTLKPRTFKKVLYEEAYTGGHLRCIWSGKSFPEFVTPEEYDIRKIFPVIPALLERWVKHYGTLTWNGSYDTSMLRSCLGVDIQPSVIADGSLLVHILDENHLTALKANVAKYRDVFGIDPHKQAATEKKELLASIIKNGGRKAGQVWLADLDVQSKYACSDAFYTFGICHQALKDLHKDFGREGLQWFFNEEVMPLATEVVTGMKEDGVYIDAPYFEGLLTETQIEMEAIEDIILSTLKSSGFLGGFALGKPEEVSQKRLMLKIIEMEGLAVPMKKTKGKPDTISLAKAAVKKAYAENPHWVFGHILGTDELKYSPEKIDRISRELHYEGLNKDALAEKKPLKRYQFNINSDPHLRWLFCERLGINPKSLPGTNSSKPSNIIPSMAAEVLTEFMLPKFPWVEALLSYKKLAKLESTYIRPAVMLNHDGWLMMNWKQNGTVTGRFSCSGGFNLQTLPRVDDELEMLANCEKCDSANVKIHQKIAVVADLECLDCQHIKKGIVRPSAIKKGFIAPPGYKIVSADYSSLEPRIFSFCSGSPKLKEVYLKGLDLYSQVYIQSFKCEDEYSAHPDDENYLKKVAPAKRKSAKPWVLGIPYGAEAGKVAILTGSVIHIVDRVTGEPVTIPDMKEGQRIIDEYLSAFPELKEYMERQELQAVTLGYVETLIGRRRHLPKAKAIQEVLQKYELDFQDLRSCAPKDLKNADCTPVNKKSGERICFCKEALAEICDRLDIDEEKIEEKGNWAYIRGILKLDLNSGKNSPIQGLAGHVTNRAMLDTARAFKQQNLQARVAMQIHDEIVAYAKVACSEAAAECLRIGMEKNAFAMKIDIPLIANPIICDNLAQAK